MDLTGLGIFILQNPEKGERIYNLLLWCLKCCYCQARWNQAVKVLHQCCCDDGPVRSGAVSSKRTEEKRAHTCEHCSEGGRWVRIVFNRWESERGACACVLRGASGVCFSFICQQANSPLITAATMTGHTPVFTRSLSPYPVYLSTHLSTLFPLVLSPYLTSLPTDLLFLWLLSPL